MGYNGLRDEKCGIFSAQTDQNAMQLYYIFGKDSIYTQFQNKTIFTPLFADKNSL